MNLDPLIKDSIIPPQWYWDSETLTINYMESEYHLGYSELFPKKEYAIWVNKTSNNMYHFYTLICKDHIWIKSERVYSNEDMKNMNLILNDICSRRLSFLEHS